MTAIKQLVDAVWLLNERRSGRSDRLADFRALARWFAEAPDEAAMHQRSRAALRALLRRPLLTTESDPEELVLVRRYVAELRDWLSREAGWRLQVDAETARRSGRTASDSALWPDARSP